LEIRGNTLLQSAGSKPEAGPPLFGSNRLKEGGFKHYNLAASATYMLPGFQRAADWLNQLWLRVPGGAVRGGLLADWLASCVSLSHINCLFV